MKIKNGDPIVVNGQKMIYAGEHKTAGFFWAAVMNNEGKPVLSVHDVTHINQPATTAKH
jgi:hypothetical protein